MKALATALVCLALPGLALGWDADEGYEKTYDRQYAETEDACGEGSPGRHIVDAGLGPDFDREAGESRVRADTAQMAAMAEACRNPVGLETSTNVAEAEAPVAAASPSSTATGGYAIPSYIVECESGGDYGASNPSGAYGAYQIMPGTASAYGCDLSTPAGQDSCAAEIYAAEGSSPWVCG